jgi:hypothetical protein
VPEFGTEVMSDGSLATLFCSFPYRAILFTAFVIPIKSANHFHSSAFSFHASVNQHRDSEAYSKSLLSAFNQIALPAYR